MYHFGGSETCSVLFIFGHVLIAAWYARRQQKKIYSPLVESLLALYLGLEWMHVRLFSCFHFCMYILILYKTK
jgi:hypothetical protein